MADDITITSVGDVALIARLDGISDRMRAALIEKMDLIQKMLEDKITTQKLSGQVLNVRTGNLRASIFIEPIEASNTQIVGRVASSSNVKYGAIHEFGGRTAPHEIVPKKAAVLAFMLGGKMAFAKRVQHPGSTMPERSFMRSAMHENRAEIEAMIREAVAEGLGK